MMHGKRWRVTRHPTGGDVMRLRIAVIAGLVVVGLAACDRNTPQESQRERDQTRDQTSDERMRQAGRSAYDAAQKAQDAAQELSRQVERAGKEARQGWDDAKREHDQQPKKQ